jgi:hypothetical protein
MSWHFSQALVEEFLEASCLDGELFAPLKSSDIPEAYCWQDKTTESLSLFQFGTMCAHSTANLGEDLLMWYRGDFLVKTSVLREQCGDARALKASDQVYGGKTSELLQRYLLPMFSVKIHQNYDNRDLKQSSENCQPSGMLQNGSLLGLTLLDLVINVTDYGSMLPTPTTRDYKDTLGMSITRKDGKTRLDRLPMLVFEYARNVGISTKTSWGGGGDTNCPNCCGEGLGGNRDFGTGLLPRVTGMGHGMADWVDRIKAIGNGQVPSVAALAWQILHVEINY